MKNNIVFKLICGISLMMLFMAGCADKEEIVYHKIQLSDSSLTFDSAGESSYTITVNSSTSEWDVEISEEWVLEAAADDNSLTISAEVNEDYEERYATIVFTNEFVTEEVHITQFGKEQEGAPKFRLLPEFQSFETSQGGKFGLAIQITMYGENEYYSTPYVINLATDERTKMETLEGTFTAGPISDDGTVMFIKSATEMHSMQWKDTEWVYVTPTDPAATECSVSEISADGSIWVGFCKNAGQPFIPVKWTNGVPQALDTPALTGLGLDVYSGVMARGCSADGSVIYGSIWDSYEAICWRDGGTYEIVGKDNLNKVEIITINGMLGQFDAAVLWAPVMYATNKHLSPNGKYLACSYLKAIAVDGNRVEQRYPLFVNLDDPEDYTLLEDDGFGEATTVSNDGLYFYGNSMTLNSGITEGFVLDPATGTSVTTTEWIRNTYGINMVGNYYVESVCADNKTVTGLKIVPSLLQTTWVPWYITTE
jgi:hypothetical protein